MIEYKFVLMYGSPLVVVCEGVGGRGGGEKMRGEGWRGRGQGQ